MKTHNLKIQSCYLTSLMNETKKCEIRQNTRNFQVGDLLQFGEIIQGEFVEIDNERQQKLTDCPSLFKITHIETYAQQKDYVVLSVELET